jgi:hypothetical protein
MSFLGQDEEHGLEGVFRLVIVVEKTLANTQNHLAMAPDEQLERVLVPALDEASN